MRHLHPRQFSPFGYISPDCGPTLSARRHGRLWHPGPSEVGERPGARRRAPTNDPPPLSGEVAASAGQRPGGGPAGEAGQRVVRGAGTTPPTGKSR